jgi:hypothetical protein
MEKLVKLWSLSWREKQACFEASFLLLTTYLAVQTISFRHIYNFLKNFSTDHAHDKLNYDEDVRLVNMALSRVANRLPWKSLCLIRSITAFIMLRRRGIPAVVFTGVKSDRTSLSAHAWVRVGHDMRDEGPESATFTVVMRIGDNLLNPGP